MRVEQLLWTRGRGWDANAVLADAHLVLYFAGPAALEGGARYNELRQFYPQAHILGCSTGGEIAGAEVFDDSVAVAALRLRKTTLKTASTFVEGVSDSFKAGHDLASSLHAPDLKYVFLLSDGMHVNGSDLVRGLYDVLAADVIVTGGLAGDGSDFRETFVGLDAAPIPKQVVAIGFYGDAIRIGFGSVGGWSPFGPRRQITKAAGSTLYELDGKPALALYKEYLGDDAARLPSSGLLFPLSIRPHADSEDETVRTILAVNEADQSLTFAGDIPQGYTAQLMRGDFNMLVEGATEAASLATAQHQEENALALLVSCIGRKLLLGQAISDETEAISELFQHRIPTVGFYSYGEICHQKFTGKCSLHNQTMTVTVLYES